MKLLNRLIEYSFYGIFLLVPLVFTSQTSELFEFNKMWLTFGLTLIIAFAWFSKMILNKRFFIQRTPLDIPILLFLTSQIISTIFSLDTHVSIWGYYSRFNGGLLSIVSYIFLYYALISNLGNLGNLSYLFVKRLLLISLISGFIVVLWGLPSHFGYDPTCFIFRGSFDVSCWTDAFQPKVRIFSTLGQPDWLAAYLAILIPIAIAFGLKNPKSETRNSKQIQNHNDKNSKQDSGVASLPRMTSFWLVQNRIRILFFLLLTVLFYLSLLYTDARSGFIAIWISLIFFLAFFIYLNLKIENKWKMELGKWKLVFIIILIFGSITFLIGTPIAQLDKFTFEGIKKQFQVQKPNLIKDNKPETPKPVPGEMGGTDSSKIRFIVWKGAIDAWIANPIFGTGVETFAFAYYKFRPIEHNMVSEWDYLYNKAHNEYLNYLTTTGAFGLGSYILMIGSFLFLTLKYLNPKSEYQNPKQIQNSNDKNSKHFEHSDFENLKLFRASSFEFRILSLALLAGYLSILITNFFGFSVVIMNLYLFLIPAFVFILAGMIDPKKILSFPKLKTEPNISAKHNVSNYHAKQNLSSFQWLSLIVITITTLYFLLKLLNFWQADTTFALGHNFNRIGQYQEAYQKLHEAVNQRGDEPTFKDEMAINDAIMAMAYASQKQASYAAILTTEAVNISDELANEYPNNVVFAKTQVRLFYALSQADPKFFPKALSAIIRANSLAPTDAKVLYNLGLLYEQSGDTKKAIEVLEKTTRYKPDYRDAFYALGLYYHELAIDKKGKVIDQTLQNKAIETMKHLINLNATDEQARQALKSWGE